jgi:3-oxo-5-alpha-steroid 4-dehydrogenase 1
MLQPFYYQLHQYLLDENIVGPQHHSSTELHTWLCILLVNTTLANLACFCGFFLGLLAPYGSESTSRQENKLPDWMWGPKINSKLGWYIMEVPALVVAVLTVVCFDLGDYVSAPMHCQLAVGMFICHYINRGIIYPNKRGNVEAMESCSTFLLGAFFNAGNAYALTRYCTYFGRGSIVLEEASVARIVVASSVFFAGVAINMTADELLLQFSAVKKLEKNKKKQRSMVPGGFFVFNYVTAANYFGELTEWFGFFLLTYPSPSSACFVYMTWCNLAPRAWSRHQRYLRTVPGYKALNRKAIVPFVL